MGYCSYSKIGTVVVVALLSLIKPSLAGSTTHLSTVYTRDLCPLYTPLLSKRSRTCRCVTSSSSIWRGAKNSANNSKIGQSDLAHAADAETQVYTHKIACNLHRTPDLYESLREVPENDVVRELTVDGTFVPKLTLGLFDNLRSIDRLSIENARLCYVVPGVFARRSALTTLSLANNSLLRFLPGAFDGLSTLKSLDLSRNKMENLDLGAVLGKSTPSLEILDLSRNRLTEISANNEDPKASSSEILPNLKILNLSGNKIRRLAPLISNLMPFLPNLLELSLVDNEIASLDDLEEFSSSLKNSRLGANNLRLLNLSGNFLTRFDWAPLRRLFPKLKRLILSRNLISRVELRCKEDDDDDAYPRNLKMLDLSSNPLQCDCQWMSVSSSTLNIHLNNTLCYGISNATSSDDWISFLGRFCPEKRFLGEKPQFFSLKIKITTFLYGFLSVFSLTLFLACCLTGYARRRRSSNTETRLGYGWKNAKNFNVSFRRIILSSRGNDDSTLLV